MGFRQVCKELVLCHEDADDRFVRMGGADFHDSFGNINIFKAEEGQVNDDDHIDAVVSEHRFQSLFIVFQRSGGDHVDRILNGGRRRQERAQSFFGLIGELSHFHSVFANRIGCHNAGTAGVGHDRNAIAFGNRAVAEHFCCVKEILKRKLADHSGLLQ